MAEISVIVPIYNTELFLNRCIDSLLSQTFTDFELFLVDDGSTDASGEICDRYALQDDRVRVFHQTNQGQAAARNHALDWVFANSESKYIAFVDSDDWVHPHFLELLHEGMTRFHVNICQCNHMETTGVEPIPEISDNMFCITAEEQYIQHYSAFMWDKLFSKSCWKEMRFPEGQIYEDVAIWYRILFAQQKLAYVDEVLYYYYINPNSTVRENWTAPHFARIKAWDAQIAFFEQYGNKTLLETALDHYCTVAVDEFYAISKSERLTIEEKKTYHANIDNRIRKLMKRYHRQLKDHPNYRWCLEAAHPILAACYWKMRSVLNALGRSE